MRLILGLLLGLSLVSQANAEEGRKQLAAAYITSAQPAVAVSKPEMTMMSAVTVPVPATSAVSSAILAAAAFAQAQPSTAQVIVSSQSHH
ncbi:MAG: hypothetical protein JSR89_11500 [Proteobacteria bacterium]|nr:hypothetical protein [Pseudomonadota bacterium]